MIFTTYEILLMCQTNKKLLHITRIHVQATDLL